MRIFGSGTAIFPVKPPTYIISIGNALSIRASIPCAMHLYFFSMQKLYQKTQITNNLFIFTVSRPLKIAVL